MTHDDLIQWVERRLAENGYKRHGSVLVYRRGNYTVRFHPRIVDDSLIPNDVAPMVKSNMGIDLTRTPEADQARMAMSVHRSGNPKPMTTAIFNVPLDAQEGTLESILEKAHGSLMAAISSQPCGENEN